MTFSPNPVNVDRLVFRQALLAIGALLIGFAGVASAQEAPQSASLVGNWDGTFGEYADVWGDGDYAYVSRFGTPTVHVIDISVPAAPVEVAEFTAPDSIPIPRHGDRSGSAQDVKVFDGLMFVGVEESNDPGFSGRTVIADVRDPTNPIALTVVNTMDSIGVHNTFYADGFLYQADSERDIVSIVDLTSYDPDAAPSFIGAEKWRLGPIGGDFVHDITVADGRLYVSAWNGGIHIFDVTDITSMPPVFLGSYRGKATHSAWPTDDGNFVVTGEERRRGGITVHRITDNGGSLTLKKTDKIKLKTKQATSVHNQVMVGNRLYNSWYEAGLRVYDIDPITGQLFFVASYDTTGELPGDYFGAWGIYPLLGADKVLITDIRGGLNIIDAHGDLPCEEISEVRSVRCKSGRIKAKVVMTDRLRDRQKLTFGIDGDSLDIRVKRGVAKLKHNGGYSGAQTLTLSSPAACAAPIDVDCG
ncbi:MAG: hypothetical protein ACI8TX_002716 [Hyphomicrobiaceae bacterium]|jgi:hypothetical protein